MSNHESSSKGHDTRREFLAKVAILFSLPFARETLSTAGAGLYALPPPDWIQRILADPDNLRLRLAYGDWLVQQGNPLGKHLRLECELAQLDHTKPDYYVVDSGRAKLAYEGSDWEQCLASHWGQERHQKMKAIAPKASFDARMRLGMLERMTIDDVRLFVSHAEDIFAEAPLIRSLKIVKSSESGALQELFRSPILERVREIEFYECELDEASLSTWAATDCNRQLREVNFNCCQLDANGIRRLLAEGSFPQLRSLEFWWTEFLDGLDHSDDLPLVRSLFHAPACPVVEKIRFGRCPALGPAAVQELVSGPLVRRLTSLDLGNEKFAPAVLERLCSVGFPALRDLCLSGGAFSNVGLSLSQMPRLESLRLSEMQLDEESVQRALKSAPPTMVDLSLRGGLISCPTAELLSALPFLSNLRFLDLGDNRIQSRGATAIANSPFLTKLVAMKLGWNQVDAEGARQIAASPNMRSLRFLHLGDNRLGAEGIMALASSSNLGNLSWLNVDENDLNETVVLALLDSPNLSNLVALRADSFHSKGPTAKRFAERFGVFDFMASYGYYGRLI